MLTIYLDFDGVLTTKFSEVSEVHGGSAFDPLCVESFKKIAAQLRQKFKSVRVVVISNWRFEFPPVEIRELFDGYGMLEKIDELIIPVTASNREEEIMNDAYDGPFLILDDQPYYNEKLKPHLIQLRSEDGLRGIEDIEQILGGDI